MGAVGGTKADALFIVAGETAIFRPHNAGHEVAIDIAVGHTLLVEHLSGSWVEVVPHSRKHTFQFGNFFKGNRSSSITFNATGTSTSIKVAAEVFGENIGR